MKKILLLQYRDDITKEHEISCFSQKIPHLQDGRAELVVVNSLLDEFDPDPENLLRGVDLFLTGASAQFDLSKKPPKVMDAISKTKKILDYVYENDFPTLGVCFGHHVLADIHGGNVEGNFEMAETGTTEITLYEEGLKDKIFSSLPHKFMAVVGHKDSVCMAPGKGTILASSEKCFSHVIRYKENVYTTQFHPELGLDDLIYRLSLFPEYLAKEGVTLEEKKKEFEETPYAQKVLSIFSSYYLS